MRVTSMVSKHTYHPSTSSKNPTTLRSLSLSYLHSTHKTTMTKNNKASSNQHSMPPTTEADNGTAATATATATPKPKDMAATAPAAETTGKEPESTLPMSTTKPSASPTETPKKTNEGAVAETTMNVTTENLVESTKTNTPSSPTSIPATVTPHKESDVLTHQANIKTGADYDVATRRAFLFDTNKNDRLRPSVSTLGALVKLHPVNGVVHPLALDGGNQATPDKAKMRNIQDSFTNDKSGETYESMIDDMIILKFICNETFGVEADEKHVSTFCGKKICQTG